MQPSAENPLRDHSLCHGIIWNCRQWVGNENIVAFDVNERVLRKRSRFPTNNKEYRMPYLYKSSVTSPIVILVHEIHLHDTKHNQRVEKP